MNIDDIISGMQNGTFKPFSEPACPSMVIYLDLGSYTIELEYEFEYEPYVCDWSMRENYNRERVYLNLTQREVVDKYILAMMKTGYLPSHCSEYQYIP